MDDVLIAEELARAPTGASAALQASEMRLSAELAGMRRLYELHATLASTTDLTAALDAILAAAVEFTGTDRGIVQLVSADGERLEIFAHCGYEPRARFIEHFLHDGSKPACDAARRDRRRLVIEDVATFPGLAGTVDREVALATGVRATQSTPMIGRTGELVGVLSTQFAQRHRSSDAELRLIDMLAWTAADFVERHATNARLRESEARHAFLLELSDVLRPLEDPAVIRAAASRLLGEHLGADRAAYAELEPDDQFMTVEGDWTRLGTASVAGRFRIDDFGTFFTDPLRAGRIAMIEDAATDSRIPSDMYEGTWALIGVRSAMAYPLVKQGRLVAAILVHQHTPRRWLEGDLSLISEVGERTWAFTQRARAEAALRVALDASEAARADAEAARAEAQASNRIKGEFLAVMSHELRTPLNAIGGYAELMEMGIRGPITDAQRADLARIQNSQRHLLSLINGVLNYAKLDAGAVYYEVTDVPLDEVLTTCEALVAPQASAKQIALTVTGCGSAARARADREKVQQIILNLLSNAIKFTDAGGCVSLVRGRANGTDGDGPWVVVQITDTGRGIAPDQRERVFQPFVQIDSRLTRAQDGTGLGLAISRDLARGMGGDLTVESTPGMGSTFTLTLARA